MAVSVVLQPNLNQNPPVQQNPQPDTRSWLGRQVSDAFLGITSERVFQVALRALTVLSVVLGLGCGLAALLGTITWPVGLAVFLTCFVGTATLAWASNRLAERQNPQYLVKMRKECAQMSLDQIVQRHGWENLFRWKLVNSSVFNDKFREQVGTKNLEQIIQYYEQASGVLLSLQNLPIRYQIPPPNEFKARWRTETRELTLEQILQTYSIEKFEKYSILDVGELRKIQELSRDYTAIVAQRDQSAQLIEREYLNSVTQFLTIRSQQVQQIEQVYTNHPSVQAMHQFELNCMRERQQLQERHDAQMNLVRGRFESAVALLTNNGKIPYSRLGHEMRILYAQHESELTAARDELNRTLQLEADQLGARHIANREVFSRESEQARTQRDESLRILEEQFNRATAPQRQQREMQLEPVLRRFANSVRDLNQRYNAFLSISKQEN